MSYATLLPSKTFRNFEARSGEHFAAERWTVEYVASILKYGTEQSYQKYFNLAGYVSFKFHLYLTWMNVKWNTSNVERLRGIHRSNRYIALRHGNPCNSKYLTYSRQVRFSNALTKRIRGVNSKYVVSINCCELCYTASHRILLSFVPVLLHSIRLDML